MPAPPTRLDTADSAAEHTAWARLCGMSPVECARAIGWTVPDGVSWGLVTALYATEAGKIVDGAGSWWCPETGKAGALEALRPTARGVFPRVSTAGEAAADAHTQCVKDRTHAPDGQDLGLTMGLAHWASGGATRSDRRSV